jgi:hypothetical protein
MESEAIWSGLAVALARETESATEPHKNHLPGMFRECVHIQQTLVKTVVVVAARWKQY